MVLDLSKALHAHKVHFVFYTRDGDCDVFFVIQMTTRQLPTELSQKQLKCCTLPLKKHTFLWELLLFILVYLYYLPKVLKLSMFLYSLY